MSTYSRTCKCGVTITSQFEYELIADSKKHEDNYIHKVWERDNSGTVEIKVGLPDGFQPTNFKTMVDKEIRQRWWHFG